MVALVFVFGFYYFPIDLVEGYISFFGLGRGRWCNFFFLGKLAFVVQAEDCYSAVNVFNRCVFQPDVHVVVFKVSAGYVEDTGAEAGGSIIGFARSVNQLSIAVKELYALVFIISAFFFFYGKVYRLADMARVVEI